ncbi:diguanylate cyclase [Clostridium sp. D2Q-11]|uniref:Diguanylate cyclase n=1 Tax=Anaeromonas frigoriresistens TaxID=2683708 RepID=A0A942UUV1_9FIRM|nr:diguanylate cyclase [Anaeromonas frigoriresistens]MBS4537214.1 diguanylate cyclase [Anaeromonas frigoriresistens]
MEIINNRYKIIDIHCESKTYTVYKAIDFLNSNTYIYLKIFNYNNTDLIKYFTKDFTDFSSLKNKYILKNYNFSIINSVDNKPVNVARYFYTSEYFTGESLINYKHKLNSLEVLSLFSQLCSACDYLSFRGINTSYLHPENILINNEGSELILKVKDIASIKGEILTNEYNTYFDFIKTPDFIKSSGVMNIYEYIYGAGKLLEYMMTSDNYNKDLIFSSKYHFDMRRIHQELLKIINKLLSHDIKIRYDNFKGIIKDLNNIHNFNYEELVKDNRESLNFNTKIIGRDEELSLIFKNDERINDSSTSKTLIMIDGEEGSGKTRLLSEIEYRLELKSREVYRSKITSENSTSFKSVKSILRTIIKRYDDKLLNKYGTEIVKLIPELKGKYDIHPSETLSGEKEKLRLYDRIANYISDVSEKTTYIIFDDFHLADKDTYNLVNYMINYVKDYPITIILTYNSDLIENNIVYNRYLKNWMYNKQSLKIRLSRFNLDETSIAMKNIMGMNIKPINFATHIYKETDGNPRYIEEVMKNLFAREELYINEDGLWDYKSESYSKMYIPNNINEAIENQLKLLPKKVYNVIEKISVFNTSISKNIINKILDKTENEELDQIIDKLVTMKLLEQKLEDWGYTYDLYNTQAKNYIYYNLTDDKRVSLHKKASNILEKLYKEEDRNNIEELIYHLKMSHQYRKAIFYAINFAKAMRKLNINSQSLEIWEMAMGILNYIDDCEYSIEIYMNLGNLTNEQGSKNKAMKYYKKALEISYEQNDFIKIVDINNLLSDINSRLAEYDIALDLAIESKKVAKRINYTDGLLTSIIAINRINFSRGKNEEIFAMSLRYLKVALEQGNNYCIAELYNQLGVISMLMGNLKDALKYYEKSVFYYEKTNNILEITKPINNLGLIYGEYYGNIDKAMEYYEQGLDISKSYNSLHNMAIFFINIGSIYIRKNKYDLAKEYTHKMLNIAIDIDEKYMVSSAYINLANIYIDTGEFDKAKIYIDELRDQYNSGLITIEDIDKYFEIALKFHLITAQWSKCNEICDEIFNRHSDEKNSFYLNSLSVKLLIKYMKNENFDVNELYHLIDFYNGTELIWDSRYYLLIWGIIALLKKDIKIVKDIVENDYNLSKEFDTEYLSLMRLVLVNALNHDEFDDLKVLYKQAKKLNIPIMELIISRILGEKYFANNSYFFAANYYLLFIESMYKLVSKLQEENIKNNFAQSFGINETIYKLRQIKHIIKNGEKLLDYNRTISTNEYFDFKEYEELFNNEKFLKTVSKQYSDSLLDNINGIDDLLDNLDTNSLGNIELIVKYAMKETLAERAIVGIYNEENDKYEILISKGMNEFDEAQKIIEKLLISRYNGYIKSSVDSGYDKHIGKNFSETITSMIFLSIESPNSSHNNMDKDRRSKKLDDQKIVGYIYLDTDKLFNKFNNKIYLKLKKLTKLILLNIDNYNFKILSSIDKLTNVYTRKYMEIAYGELYNKCRKEDTIYSLLMADIDKFKDVNDTYGHQKGDLILKKVGEILRESIRSSDIVARYGGEEFIIILPLTNKDEAYIVAEKIRKRINNEKLLDEPGNITISIGVSQYPIHGQFKDEIIEKADQALYNSKNTGRNKTIIWEKSLTKPTKRIDKLAGIVTGNTVQDHRIVSAMVEIIELIKEDISKTSKYFLMLGRLIEITEAKEGTLILLNNDKSIKQIYTRERFIEDWIDKHKINQSLINKVIEKKTGEYLIDWEQINEIDNLTGNPDWQSVVIVPIISSGSIKGIIQLSVPIKEKEFDYNIFNFANVISDVASILV